MSNQFSRGRRNQSRRNKEKEQAFVGSPHWQEDIIVDLVEVLVGVNATREDKIREGQEIEGDESGGIDALSSVIPTVSVSYLLP